jgi:hypothetical protein
MNIFQAPSAGSIGVGYITAAVITAWLVYVTLAGGLVPGGRNFLILGAVRIALFAALIAFARLAIARTGLVGRVGFLLAAVGAAAYVGGAVASIAVDGWSFNPMADGNADPPLYLIVLGLSANLFALGTVLVGIAGRAGGWLAAAVVLAGLLYPLVLFPLQPFGTTAGHVVWLAAYLVLAGGLVASKPASPRTSLPKG